jgi:hypothetical protein
MLLNEFLHTEPSKYQICLIGRNFRSVARGNRQDLIHSN